MGLRLYYFPTPNGRKVSIALEEMGLAYAVEPVNILDGEQQAPAFLALSPNGRIPALVDEIQDDKGADDRVVIFESGAILQYLGRKSGRFYPQRESERAWIDAWVFWQMAGLGPMTGQINWFARVAETPGRDPRDSSYALHRYTKETRRLYGVLERQLTGRDYICDAYSIADMACWPWVEQYHHRVGGLGDYPHIAAWRDRIAARPAVQRALALGMDWAGKKSGEMGDQSAR
ncbi:glutathione S-transferase N-terminal domain-containing protein [Phenylobacterium sp. LjRoot219]|uniref:glutathione S-transferase family protein n=1 Tax=Phenylobacterium sp. LjRoot219 TaxID=3342283 RepID=UPI003ED0A316